VQLLVLDGAAAVYIHLGKEFIDDVGRSVEANGTEACMQLGTFDGAALISVPFTEEVDDAREGGLESAAQGGPNVLNVLDLPRTVLVELVDALSHDE
jgi:hypothetical protein